MTRGKDGKTCSRNEDKLLSVSSPKMPQLRRIVMNYATAFFACALTLAQRLWVAFEIFALAAADNTRFRSLDILETRGSATISRWRWC